MNKEYFCWKCGATLVDLILPLSRRETCIKCNADQHVCKMCQFYRHQDENDCDEERADPPADAETANFCDYFMLAKKSTVKQKADTATSARADLEALFGDDSSDTSESSGNCQSATTKKELALAELNKLFGEGEK